MKTKSELTKIYCLNQKSSSIKIALVMTNSKNICLSKQLANNEVLLECSRLKRKYISRRICWDTS